jgi:hypothetical protein
LETLKNWLIESTFKKNWLTYETIFNSVNDIKNKMVKEKISEFLLSSDIKWMQKYLGMKERSLYYDMAEGADNKADWNFSKATLDRLTNPLFWLSFKEFIDYPGIPKDVKEAYEKFATWTWKPDKFNSGGLNYAIISKTDCNIYVFKWDHTLLSRNKVLLGKKIWDTPNEAYEDKKKATTPAGIYSINTKIYDKSQYAWPGEYMSLYPMEEQYDLLNSKWFTLWIHNYYTKDEKRLKALKESWKSRRISMGCINTLSDWVIYDNLTYDSKTKIWSRVYVTNEPK